LSQVLTELPYWADKSLVIMPVSDKGGCHLTLRAHG
jgi:hypothetical protein